ncbi:MAG: tetratricopeptide repeat protein, partial [Armatimonadota bacterium]|nr:tetratricopeptide repeat protein [Armatimonadota bacterium]
MAKRSGVLPSPRSSLIGRAAETDAVTEILLRPEVRVVTLTGAPGIGKTRLALEVAGRLAGRFSGGVAFIDLSAVTDPVAVGAAIAQSLGIREVSSQPLVDTLRDAIAEQRLLLVLDNFEQVLPAAPVVAELLDGCPSLTVLLTSRAPLRIRGEQEFPVPPLPLPEERSAAEPRALREVASVALFVERARAVRPDFTLTSANAAAVADICVRLDGLPLAIELAAARVKLLTPAGILRRLRSSLDLLSRQSPDVPPRHRTLRQAIRWSYDLLEGGEQVLLRRLAAFSGGAALDAVEAVCRAETDPAGSVLDALGSLVENSLLLHDPQPDGESRFRMLETVREFAQEELEASGEGPALWERHAAHFAQLAQAAEPALAGPDQAVWLERLEREHDNFRVALAWSAEAGRAETGLTIAIALGRFWERHGYSGEGLSWLQRFLAMAPLAPAALRATALNIAGNLARSRGDYGLAVSSYEHTLALRREAQDARGIAVALNNLGVVAKDQGDYVRARAFLEESLAIKRREGDRRGVAVTLSNLGLTAKAQGDLAAAAAFFSESLGLFQGLGDTWGQALCLNNMGT